MNSNRVTLAQLRGMSAKEAASLPTDHIALLLEDVAAQKADTKLLDDILHEACVLKFGASADALRKQDGKDTGRVTIEADGYLIRADLPKKVEWEQSKLEQAIETVRAWGESPSDFVNVKLTVPEAKYNAWPPSIRKVFEPARVVGTGKPTFSIERRAAA